MQNREEVTGALQEAATLIVAEADSRLIPARGGIRMGYALPGATVVNDVCAVDGGIVQPFSSAVTARFGTDAGVARVLLTIIRHEGCLRSVAALRCTPDILHCVTDDLALDACAYPPSPPGSGTMDWGVESCCRDGVPDVIYLRKTERNDPFLWIITETPADVARTIRMLSGLW